MICFYPNSQENSSDSITSSSRGESGRSRHNGNSSKHSPQDSSSDLSNDRKEKGALVSEKRVQVILVSCHTLTPPFVLRSSPPVIKKFSGTPEFTGL